MRSLISNIVFIHSAIVNRKRSIHAKPWYYRTIPDRTNAPSVEIVEAVTMKEHLMVPRQSMMLLFFIEVKLRIIRVIHWLLVWELSVRLVPSVMKCSTVGIF